MHKERLFTWRKSAEKLFYCDIRALLDCDILTGFGGLKNEVVRHSRGVFALSSKYGNGKALSPAVKKGLEAHLRVFVPRFRDKKIIGEWYGFARIL